MGFCIVIAAPARVVARAGAHQPLVKKAQGDEFDDRGLDMAGSKFTAPEHATSAAEANTVAGSENRNANSAPTSATPPETLSDRVYALRFAALEASAYHAERQHFLVWTGKVLTGLQVLLGTSAVATLANAIPGSAAMLILLAATIGVIQLVADPASGAGEHKILRMRFSDVLARLDNPRIRPGKIERLAAAMAQLRADSPPVYVAVQAIAYNRAVRAIHGVEAPREYFFDVNWFRRALANFWAMRGETFEKMKPVASDHD